MKYQKTIYLSVTVMLLFFSIISSVAATETSELTVFASNDNYEYIMLDEDEKVELTVTTTYSSCYLSIIYSEDYTKWSADPLDPTISYIENSDPLLTSGDNEYTFTATEFVTIYVIVENLGVSTAYISLSWDITDTSSSSSNNDDDDEKDDGFDLGFDLDGVGLGFLGGFVGVAGYLITFRIKQKKQWKKEDEENPTPWPKRGKEAKQYAQKMSQSCVMESYLTHQMYNMQPGQETQILIEMYNGHDLPIVMDTVQTDFFYGYTPTEQELDAMRRQLENKIKAKYSAEESKIKAEIQRYRNMDGDWHMRIESLQRELQEVGPKRDEELQRIYSSDPRDFLDDWKKLDINGIDTYVKPMQGTWTAEMEPVPIVPNDRITFPLSLKIPGNIPNMGNQGKDFFSGVSIFMRFKPEGCQWTDDIRASQSRAEILPIINSDRPHTFKMADEMGVVVTTN